MQIGILRGVHVRGPAKVGCERGRDSTLKN